jgi:myo-inositol 2-dehydrogenase/D-chiro-inositol 1-dehydrogenase
MKLRIGFIGAGGIAQIHLRNLANMEDVSVTAICDKLIENAEKSATAFGAKAYGNMSSMIDQEVLDGVYVCLPPFEHGEPEITAAGKGIHLFIEKPLGLSCDVCAAVKKAIEASGIVCSVGYNLRYLDITEQARSILAQNQPGLVLGYNLTDFPWEKPWWRDAKKSGGQVVEQTTHIIDLERYLVGEVQSVQCLSKLQLMMGVENMTIDDVSTINVAFRSGAIGSIVSSCCAPRPTYRIGVEILCKDLMLTFCPYGPHASLTVVQSNQTQQFLSRNDPFFDEDRAFIQAVRSGTMSGIRSSYDDALKSVQVSIAANDSARQRESVSL